jgi:hypothetical protein
MTTKDKCPACGKKMKLICPYEWTMKDEKAFKLGEKSQNQKIIEEIEKCADHRGIINKQELLNSLGEKDE